MAKNLATPLQSKPDLQINMPGSFIINGNRIEPNLDDEATKARYQKKDDDKKVIVIEPTDEAAQS